MEAQYVNEIAQTILSQIKMTTQPNVYWSWGAKGFVATIFNNMPALKFRVSGLNYSGYVIVSLNEGSDTYEIYKMKVKTKETEKVYDDVYCDQLGELLDKLIETGNKSNEEYHENVISYYKAHQAF